MIRDGGPAFPRPHSTAEWGEYIDEDRPAQPGMSLRDYFAGQVLAGIVDLEVGRLLADDERDAREVVESITEWAWMLADSMIEARGVYEPSSDVQQTLPNSDDEDT